MARPPAISMHRARGASVPSRRCIRSPGSARRVARSVPVPSGRPRWLSPWPRSRPGPLGPEPARRPGSERPGPLRPPGRSGMHVNLEKVTEHAGPVLRGRAWAHAGPHTLVGVPDKGLQWRQPWTRDSILRATLAWWVVGCKTAEARSGGSGVWGLAVRWPEAVPRCEELRERLLTALGCFCAPRSPTQVTPDSSQRPWACQRSASGGQDVVWQGGGRVHRGQDQGWRGSYLLVEMLKRSGTKNLMKSDTAGWEWHRLLLDNFPG
ncbi:uncharacterized protein LOC110310082 [Mus caroli]|uniref:Uncharacterized protein LOC110310082 n=1 Tax=Mus caroli TaxID=10089 RepID=A0A6P5R1P8_MUSCR|nr:uncharacterized protein LOC110310082 [Mus caroli]XP_029326021.1 uncharacterized protein LOC110310082 [Mus caroli]